MDEQNSAYRPTSFASPGAHHHIAAAKVFLPTGFPGDRFTFFTTLPCNDMATRTKSPVESDSYPTTWNRVADLRVLKTEPSERPFFLARLCQRMQDEPERRRLQRRPFIIGR